MTTLLLVRHGRSTSNTAGTLAGRTPGIDLDETGRSQAMSVGERLRGVSLAAAVRSPMERCEQTLDLLLASAGLEPPVTLDDQFTECDYGQWSNRELSALAGEPLWRDVQQHPSSVRFPEGESMREMAERVRDGVAAWNQRLAAEAAAGVEPVWLLVSHGDPIKAILSQALGQHLDEFQRIMVDPASVSIVRYPGVEESEKGARPLVVAMNTVAGQLAPRLPSHGPAPQLGGGLGSQQG